MSECTVAHIYCSRFPQYNSKCVKLGSKACTFDMGQTLQGWKMIFQALFHNTASTRINVNS